jgi:hypothetical protein
MLGDMDFLYRLLVPLFTLAVMSSCLSDVQFRPLMARTLELSAADFGPQALSAPLLGQTGAVSRVVVHYGLPEAHLRARYPEAGVAFVPVVRGVKHLNRVVKELPHDAAHTELRARLVATRARLIDFYNDQRIAFNSVPPFTGRSFMARNAMMPAMGTTR